MEGRAPLPSPLRAWHGFGPGGGTGGVMAEWARNGRMDAAALAGADAAGRAMRGWSRWRRGMPRRSSPPTGPTTDSYVSCPRAVCERGGLCQLGGADGGKADPLFFAVIDREKKQPAVASLMRIAPEAGSIEVGNINPLVAGLAADAGGERGDLSLRRLGVPRGLSPLRVERDALNRPSRRAAERMGFSYEGVFRQAAVVKGRNRDTAWFAMTDGDWRCLKPAWEAWLEPANFDAGGRQERALRELTTPCRVAADPL